MKRGGRGEERTQIRPLGVARFSDFDEMTTVENTQSKLGGRNTGGSRQTIVRCESSVKKLHVSSKVFTDLQIALKIHGAAICKSCDFKVQFGTTTGKDQHRSSENLFLPSKRQECFGTILSEIIKSVGLHVPNDPSRYSSRVCNKRARKIRNLGHIRRSQVIARRAK